jgi:AraC-like DNA-binding protein
MSDPLSDVLALLEMQSVATARLEAGGAWALHFPARSYFKFNAVLKGRCWIAVDGYPACLLESGDTFLLSGASAYVLSAQPFPAGAVAGDGARLFAEAAQAHSNSVQYGGSETILIGGGFEFASENAVLLHDSLPDFMHIPGSDAAATIVRGTLAVLNDELSGDRMGAALMTRRLADILLVQVLRAYVTLHGTEGAGWMGAIADARIGAALRQMHRAPGFAWSVAALASGAGMSRSGFALRFRQLVGVGPLAYLTDWRMQLARHRLRHRGVKVAALAAELGYASESAFGNAFKRRFGHAPKRYWQASAGLGDAIEQS